VIVLDILLFCNLVLFAVCAVRSPKAKGTRIEDLVRQATASRVPQAPRPGPSLVAEDNIVPFPSVAELVRRRARTAHPSAGLPTGFGHHPSRLG
jgi:hypothetical protein